MPTKKATKKTTTKKTAKKATRKTKPANNKTVATARSVDTFIASVDHTQRRADAEVVLELMKTITKAEPKLWGPSIVGFGTTHLVYESGREMDWFYTGFSPRKASLTLYIMDGFANYEELLGQLGKHKTGKGCLYINKLDDVDLSVLKKLITQSVRHMKKKYG